MVRGIPSPVAREKVLRRLGIGTGGLRSPGRIGEIIDAAIVRGIRLLSPAAVWKTMEITCAGEDLVSFKGTPFRIRSTEVASLLAGCLNATLLAATVGGELSLETERLMAETRMTEAMALDALGSEAVEEAVNSLCRGLGESGAALRLAPTRRFSPGYGDWDLTSQRGLVEELEAGRIGIGVSATAVLVPEKSVTAILGWKPR